MFQMPMSSPMMKTMLGFGAGPAGAVWAAAGVTAQAPQSIVPPQANAANFRRFMVVSCGSRMPALRGHGSAGDREFRGGCRRGIQACRTGHAMPLVEGCLTQTDKRLTAWDSG